MRPSGWLGRRGLLLLLLCQLLICLPRFNTTGSGPPSPLGPDQRPPDRADSQQYADLIEYLRGHGDPSTLIAPFAYRLAGPAAASLLPLDPLTALNVVNIVSLLLATSLVFRTVLLLPRGAGVALACSALFGLSFPTYYYGTIGYVDPLLILFLALLVFAQCARRPGLAAAAFIMGCLSKETMLLVAPAYLAHAGLGPDCGRRRKILLPALVVAAGVMALAAARWMIPVARDFTYAPALELFLGNASRPRAWGGIILSAGIPVPLLSALFCLRRARKALSGHEMVVPLSLGIMGSAIMVLLSFGAAYADGRPVWTVHPFALPMIAIMWPERVDSPAPAVAARA